MMPRIPTQIHFVDGEKGGIGKSFFCRTLIDYCFFRGGDVHVVDSDTTNPDVSRFYPGETSSLLTFSQKDSLVFGADRLFSLAASKPVVVNLPAQSHLSVLEWMEKNYLLSLDGDLPLEIYKWFVCTGTEDSVALFLKSLADYQGSYVRHVLVKNLAFCKEWDFLLSDPSFVQLGGLDLPSLELPHLAPFESDLLLSKHLTFNVAASSSASSLRMLSRKRVYDYFSKVVDAIEALSLIRFYSFPPEPEPVAPAQEQEYEIVVDF
jgi:hypothetical protein